MSPRAIFLRRVERRVAAGVQFLIVLLLFVFLGVVAAHWVA